MLKKKNPRRLYSTGVCFERGHPKARPVRCLHSTALWLNHLARNFEICKTLVIRDQPASVLDGMAQWAGKAIAPTGIASRARPVPFCGQAGKAAQCLRH